MEEAKIYVVEEVRFTYGCSHCHDGSQMQTTERPPQAAEKSPFGPSILAWLVTWKFLHHLPVYRQQELLLGPLKRWLSRALLCGLLSRTAQALMSSTRRASHYPQNKKGRILRFTAADLLAVK
jgi:transposase